MSSVSGSLSYSGNLYSNYSAGSSNRNSLAAAVSANSVDDKLDLSSAALSLIDNNAKGRVNNNIVAKVQTSAEIKSAEQKIKTGNEVIESLDAILAETASVAAETVGTVVDIVV